MVAGYWIRTSLLMLMRHDEILTSHPHDFEMVAVLGVEPRFSGYEPGAFPLDDTALRWGVRRKLNPHDAFAPLGPQPSAANQYRPRTHLVSANWMISSRMWILVHLLRIELSRRPCKGQVQPLAGAWSTVSLGPGLTEGATFQDAPRATTPVDPPGLEPRFFRLKGGKSSH